MPNKFPTDPVDRIQFLAIVASGLSRRVATQEKLGNFAEAEVARSNLVKMKAEINRRAAELKIAA